MNLNDVLTGMLLVYVIYLNLRISRLKHKTGEALSLTVKAISKALEIHVDEMVDLLKKDRQI